MQQGNYSGYKEANIEFLPSYKMDKKKMLYIDKKDQAPSYCDRVIYKNNSSMEVQEIEYDCLHDVHGSDHRPAVLKLNIKDFDCPEYCILEDLIKKPTLGYGEYDVELVDL